MKKLMIVAAVAAMAGAAVAEDVVDYVYDFTASVKSTGAKKGKTTKTSYKVNVGRDDAGKWWWDAAGYASDVEAKAAVKEMDDDEKAQLAEDLGFDKATGETDFNVKNQKGKWCYSFTFKEITDALCYRVAKSYKLKDQVVFVNGCCAPDAIEAVDADAFVFGYQRFGSQALAKATSIEAFGNINGDIEGSNGGVFAEFAGQGKLAKDGSISTVSGNIIGLQNPPSCWDCCDDDEDAVAFECDATEDADADDALPTVLYGTWNMKYNKKASAALND